MVVRCPGEIKFDSLSFPAAAAARHNFHQRKFAYCWFCQTLGRNLEAAISRDEMIKTRAIGFDKYFVARNYFFFLSFV